MSQLPKVLWKQRFFLQLPAALIRCGPGVRHRAYVDSLRALAAGAGSIGRTGAQGSEQEPETGDEIESTLVFAVILGQPSGLAERPLVVDTDVGGH